MRLSYVIPLFVVAGYTSATVSPILGAVSGITALGSSLAGLAGMIPAGLLLPLLMLKAPLKLGLLVKLGLLKAPVLAPIVATKGAAALVTKGHFASAFESLSHATMGLLEAPLKLTAMKIGAVHGAWAGGKAALASYKTLPKPSIIHATVVPAQVLLDQSQQVIVPAPEPVELTYGRKPAAPAYAPPAPPAYAPPVAEPEPEAPSYGHKAPAPPSYTPAPPSYTPAPPSYTPAPPSYTPAPPAYTPAPPAYVPAAPEVHYRKRREAEGAGVETDENVFRETFTFIHEMDKNNCVIRTVCEIAVEPSIARGFGDDILSFVHALSDDESEPWRPYKHAVVKGENSKSRDICHREYPTCNKSAEDLVDEALLQLE